METHDLLERLYVLEAHLVTIDTAIAQGISSVEGEHVTRDVETIYGLTGQLLEIAKAQRAQIALLITRVDNLAVQLAASHVNGRADAGMVIAALEDMRDLVLALHGGEAELTRAIEGSKNAGR